MRAKSMFLMAAMAMVTMFLASCGDDNDNNAVPFTQFYQQTNLVSNIPGLAATTDANLVNSWGIARSATSPWWVNDNGTGVATVYSGAGAPAPRSPCRLRRSVLRRDTHPST